MFGAATGDYIGSIYEWNNIKTKEFELFGKKCMFTDDTMMSAAVAQALLSWDGNDRDELKESLIDSMKYWGRKDLNAGYGGTFIRWLMSESRDSYGSYGNGSAMRVSAAGWLYDTLEKTLDVASATAEVTHDHPEGIKGAQAVAAAIYLARTGKDKVEIKEYIEGKFGYDLSRRLADIRPGYRFDVSCQGSVPEAIIAFLESEDFEDAIRNAISIGGDSDTIGAITGSIAEAYYGIPDNIGERIAGAMDEEMFKVFAEVKVNDL